MSKCALCHGTGYVCNNCGWPKDGCECAKREAAETGAPLGMVFEPFACDDCKGAGEVNVVTRFVCSAPKCTDGEHKMDGPVVQVGRAYSVSCSKCGVSAFEVDTYMGGF